MNPNYAQHLERVEEATTKQEITDVVVSMENPQGDLDHAGTSECMHVNMQELDMLVYY